MNTETTPEPKLTRTRLNAARTGKIARLPKAIRDQINLRLQDGETAQPILDWLNHLPEVQQVLNTLFDGRPINPSNLSEWRRGGYRDWLSAQDALNLLRSLDDLDDQDHKQLLESLAKKLAQWTALQYAANAQAMITDEEDPERRWKHLRQLTADVSRIRRSELEAERVALERERMTFDHTDAAHTREQRYWQWTRKPEIADQIKARQTMDPKLKKLIDDYFCGDTPYFNIAHQSKP